MRLSIESLMSERMWGIDAIQLYWLSVSFCFSSGISAQNALSSSSTFVSPSSPPMHSYLLDKPRHGTRYGQTSTNKLIKSLIYNKICFLIFLFISFLHNHPYLLIEGLFLSLYFLALRLFARLWLHFCTSSSCPLSVGFSQRLGSLTWPWLVVLETALYANVSSALVGVRHVSLTSYPSLWPYLHLITSFTDWIAIRFVRIVLFALCIINVSLQNASVLVR